MSKSTFFQIANKLKSMLLKKRKVLKIHPCGDFCFLCYLQTCNFFICSELFIVGKSIVSVVLHKFNIIVNVVFKKLISWQWD